MHHPNIPEYIELEDINEYIDTLDIEDYTSEDKNGDTKTGENSSSDKDTGVDVSPDTDKQRTQFKILLMHVQLSEDHW